MNDRLAAVCLFLFMLFIGLGQCAIVPPFEGMDEEGHYSSIRQVADMGTLPLLGNAFLDQTVVNYRKEGSPLPYISSGPNPLEGAKLYKDFFERKDAKEPYLKRYRTTGANVPFQPSQEPNWQVQHPPLYYLLMGLVANVSSGLSFWGQFFVMRVFSFLMALGGLAIGLAGTLRFMRSLMSRTPIVVCEETAPFAFSRIMKTFGKSVQQHVVIAFLLFPLMAAQFFPEFARLGNDALCLLLFGLFWSLFLRWLIEGPKLGLTIGIGITLMLGLLTKALFLPITAAFGALVVWRLWQMRADWERMTNFFDRMLPVGLPILVGLSWYFYKWKTMGSFVGHPEYQLVAEQGDYWSLWLERATLRKFMGGFWAIPLTFLWGGTASLARPPVLFFLPMLALFCWPFLRYLWGLRRQKLDSFLWTPLWFIVPMFLGLADHVFVLLALEGHGGTPGWYLHTLLPAFAFALGYGLEGLLYRRFFALLLGYACFFLLWILWAQLPLFAGVAIEGAGKAFVFSTVPFDLPQASLVMERLSILVWPWAGVGCFAVGFVALGLGLAILGSRKEAIGGNI